MSDLSVCFNSESLNGRNWKLAMINFNTYRSWQYTSGLSSSMHFGSVQVTDQVPAWKHGKKGNKLKNTLLRSKSKDKGIERNPVTLITYW